MTEIFLRSMCTLTMKSDSRLSQWLHQILGRAALHYVALSSSPDTPFLIWFPFPIFASPPSLISMFPGIVTQGQKDLRNSFSLRFPCGRTYKVEEGCTKLSVKR